MKKRNDIKTIILSLLLLGVICCANIANATTYYISDSGNDSNDGLSWATAWASVDTIGVSSGAFQGGDTVFINGTFLNLPEIPAHYGGTSSDRTAIIAGNGVDNTPTRGGATLSTGDSLNGTWTSLGSGVYRHDNPWSGIVTGVSLNDSILFQYDNDDLTPEGSYFNYDANYIYLTLPDSSDPNGEYMMAWDDVEEYLFSYQSADIPIGTTGHTTYWGLNIKYCNMAMRMYQRADLDSVYFERCNVSFIAGGYGGGNFAAFTFMANDDRYDTTEFMTGWRIRACSLGYIAGQWEGKRSDWGIVEVYTYMDFTIDSNIVYGNIGNPYATNESGNGGRCFYFKNNTSSGPSMRAVVAYNDISPDYATSGIYVGRHNMYNEIYGNIINIKGHGHNITESSTGIIFVSNTNDVGGDITPYTSFTKIYNNTVYNCATGIGGSSADDGMIGWGNEVKYNIFYNTDDLIGVYRGNNDTTGGYYSSWEGDGSYSWAWELTDSSSTHFIQDSNMYYATTNDVEFQFRYSPSLYYQTVASYFAKSGWDEHSTIGVDPDFNAASFGDFSRPSASQEMSRVHAGKSWTLYGAWQTGDTVTVDIIPPEETDDLDTLSDSLLGALNHGEVYLTWTAPGDDGAEGFVHHYQIIASTSLSAIQQWHYDFSFYVPNSDTAGVTKTVKLEGLDDGVEYYYALKAFDESGLISGSSNIVNSYASGIKPPDILSTLVDTNSVQATLTCSTVPSYYNNITYQFSIVDTLFDQTTFLTSNNVNINQASVLFDIYNIDNKYKWSCRAIEVGVDSSDWSEFSSYFSLTNFAPNTLIAIAPIQNDTLVNSAVSLSVENGFDSDDGPNPLIYEFEVYNEATNSLILNSNNISEGNESTTFVGTISDTGTYSWRARCFDGIDFSNWMDSEVFTIISLAAGNTPEDFEIISYPNPILLSQNDFVTFRLPNNEVDVLIISVAGETVLLKKGVSNNWDWNLINETGYKLSVGTYLWYVNELNQKGKIVIKP